jgi:hypothetical protein
MFYVHSFPQVLVFSQFPDALALAGKVGRGVAPRMSLIDGKRETARNRRAHPTHKINWQTSASPRG